jgi:3-methyladenine DNA glycosylase AlkD
MAKGRTAKAKAPAGRPAKGPAPRMTLPEAMRALEKEGSAGTRRTYARHGAKEPMFGVSFASLKTLAKRIGVDHELALALWDTGNFDARNLAVRVVDPARMSSADLDRWARGNTVRMCGLYVAALAAEGPHAAAKASAWLAAKEEPVRCTAWGLLGQMAMRDEAAPDAWFEERLAEIERTIHAAPNGEREAMNLSLISIGGRSAALRKAALAASRRIGKVEVDHGDTACRTPDAGPYLEKMWARAAAMRFPSPAAQERARESPRTRC